MEIIQFDLLGFHLQEPMALITNWMIASFAFFAYFNLKKGISVFQDYWKTFYLILGISMIFGGLGHLFFQYTGIPGKFPSWSLGVLAGVFSSFAMISMWPNVEQQKRLRTFVLIKSVVLLSTALITRKFVFVAIDTSLSYLVFCGYLGYRLIQKNLSGMRFIVLGVLVLLPSAFIFGLKINLHRFLNKDDLSHLFMVGCIACFYLGIKQFGETQKQVSVK